MARLVQYPVQSRPKRMQGKSLLDELANPPFSALLFVSLSPHSGQDDDGCPWVDGPDLLEHFESLPLGHREVENRDIGVFPAKHLDPLSPAGCEQDVVALPPQNCTAPLNLWTGRLVIWMQETQRIYSKPS